jgi:hypothetical protein
MFPSPAGTVQHAHDQREDEVDWGKEKRLRFYCQEDDLIFLFPSIAGPIPQSD